MNRIVEIRSYSLKSGSGEAFQRLVTEQSIPMLKRWKVDVVCARSSLHDEDSYVLVRSYASLAERQESQDRFYGSTEWRNGPREAILALIETTTSVVLELDEGTIECLRRL